MRNKDKKKCLSFIWNWSHVLEKSGSGVMDHFPMIPNRSFGSWKMTNFGLSQKRLQIFPGNAVYRWSRWICGKMKLSRNLMKSRSGVMDHFPMIQNAEKWTHFGFSRFWGQIAMVRQKESCSNRYGGHYDQTIKILWGN